MPEFQDALEKFEKGLSKTNNASGKDVFSKKANFESSAFIEDQVILYFLFLPYIYKMIFSYRKTDAGTTIF